MQRLRQPRPDRFPNHPTKSPAALGPAAKYCRWCANLIFQSQCDVSRLPRCEVLFAICFRFSSRHPPSDGVASPLRLISATTSPLASHFRARQCRVHSRRLPSNCLWLVVSLSESRSARHPKPLWPVLASPDESAPGLIVLSVRVCSLKRKNITRTKTRKARLRVLDRDPFLFLGKFLRASRRASRKNYAAFLAGAFNKSIAFLNTVSSGENGFGSAGVAAGPPFVEESSSAPSSAEAVSCRTTSVGVTPSAKIDLPSAL